jgi:hypothetical protein
MPAIFISLSTDDNQAAQKIAHQLRGAGYQSLFLDFDVADGIPAGRRWQQELFAALRACDAVVFLCTPASVQSRWCFAELSLARSLDRPIIGLLLDRTCTHPLLDDVQTIKWYEDPVAGQERLLVGLQKARVSSFQPSDWDLSRSPYP